MSRRLQCPAGSGLSDVLVPSRLCVRSRVGCPAVLTRPQPAGKPKASSLEGPRVWALVRPCCCHSSPVPEVPSATLARGGGGVLPKGWEFI